jgi:hypothetical protein
MQQACDGHEAGKQCITSGASSYLNRRPLRSHLQVELVTKHGGIFLTYQLIASDIQRRWHEPPHLVISLATVKSSPMYAALQATLRDPTFLPTGVPSSPQLHAKR